MSVKIDEGYSDDTRSHDDQDFKEGHDLAHGPGEQLVLPEWILALNDSSRAGKEGFFL